MYMKKYSNTNKDITRIGWEDLITRDKSQPESFKHLNSCLTVEKRESFDATNKTLNNLNDEILQLKRKLKEMQECNFILYIYNENGFYVSLKKNGKKVRITFSTYFV